MIINSTPTSLEYDLETNTPTPKMPHFLVEQNYKNIYILEHIQIFLPMLYIEEVESY